MTACTARPPIVPQPLAAEKTAPAAEPAAPPEIPERSLQQLLDQWLAAQNQAQFDAYRALYAEKFSGIKRAGPRELRLDRAAWFNDRKRMFLKPMKVEARAPKFQAAIKSAQVTFTQHFASGNFEDLGEKRMLVVMEAGQLRIEHEEMLRSELVAPRSPNPAPAKSIYLTLALHSGTYVLLPEAAVPAKLGAYRTEEAEDGPDIYTISRTLQDRDLEPAVSTLKGQKLRLEDGCVATISRFVAMTRVIPHFSEQRRWEGISEDEDEHLKPLSSAQIARAAYHLGVPELYAKLEGCKEGDRYAQPEAAPAPIPAQQVGDAELEERALAAFIQLPSVLDNQKAYLEENQGATGHWWDENTVAVYKHPKSGQMLVSVKASFGGDGCGDFSASAWVIYEKQGSALKLVLPETSPLEIQTVFDIDGDGRLEILTGPFEPSVIWPGTDRSGPGLSIVDLDCHC